LVGTTLELSLSSDEEQPHQMNLDSINTDNQQLSLTDTTLSLEEGGQIYLSPFYDNTDAQTLTMSIPTSRTLNLEIQHGNSITLESSGNLSFLKTSSDTAVFHLTESPFSLIQNTVSNQNQQWMLDDFFLVVLNWIMTMQLLKTTNACFLIRVKLPFGWVCTE